MYESIPELLYIFKKNTYTYIYIREYSNTFVYIAKKSNIYESIPDFHIL